MKLFLEDSEAVFFDNKKEFLTKILFYIENSDERNTIALKGYEKIKKLKVSWDDLMLDAIVKISKHI